MYRWKYAWSATAAGVKTMTRLWKAKRPPALRQNCRSIFGPDAWSRKRYCDAWRGRWSRPHGKRGSCACMWCGRATARGGAAGKRPVAAAARIRYDFHLIFVSRELARAIGDFNEDTGGEGQAAGAGGSARVLRGRGARGGYRGAGPASVRAAGLRASRDRP